VPFAVEFLRDFFSPFLVDVNDADKFRPFRLFDHLRPISSHPQTDNDEANRIAHFGHLLQKVAGCALRVAGYKLRVVS
jgi:hypothetical protein